MANRPSFPYLRLPPLDERDIHPQRARVHNSNRKRKVPPVGRQHSILRPLQLHKPTAKLDGLPSLSEIGATNLFGRLLRNGPWASGNEYGTHPKGSSPDKWVFSPRGTTVYEGSWRRMTDNKVLVDLESHLTQVTSPVQMRHDYGTLVAQMNGIPVYDNPSDPFAKPSRTRSTIYLHLDSRLGDKLDRARRMLSSIMDTHECDVDCPYKGAIVGSKVSQFQAQSRTV